MISGATQKPLAWYKSLQTSAGRIEARAFLIEGWRSLSQIMVHHSHEILEILTTDAEQIPKSVHCPISVLSYKQLKSISSLKTPQNVCGVVRIPDHYYSSVLPDSIGTRILICEDIQDPGNIGSLVRCAAAFGFDGMILSLGCADPFGPKASQACAGSLLNVWMRRTAGFINLVESLKKREFTLVATGLKSSLPSQLSSYSSVGLLLGNEGNGLSLELAQIADVHVTIPMNFTAVESLSVAAAGAICMFLCRGGM